MASLSYIAIGSNLNNPYQQVTEAVDRISRLPNCILIDQSPWYQTSPIGPKDQPDYINGVVLIETRLQPIELLNALQTIENTQGRVREKHWGPRTIDLDILLFGEQTIAHDRLIIPHPEMKNRNFVLYPLAEITPHLVLPDGSMLKELLENCPSNGMVLLSEPTQ